ncbi:myb-like protein X isoform X1 [Watersipora subatra]|uniref:myb-like protein X isoform X1 n=1 Tax=Watersipora subatra TaxID=2589382 RepID=UPI00355C96C2
MSLKVYITLISGNNAVRKKQQAILDALDVRNIDYSVVDVSAPENEEERAYMREKARPSQGHNCALPPQVFYGDEYVGDYEKFAESLEDNSVEAFFKQAPQKRSLNDSGVENVKDEVRTETKASEEDEETLKERSDVEIEEQEEESEEKENSEERPDMEIEKQEKASEEDKETLKERSDVEIEEQKEESEEKENFKERPDTEVEKQEKVSAEEGSGADEATDDSNPTEDKPTEADDAEETQLFGSNDNIKEEKENEEKPSGVEAEAVLESLDKKGDEEETNKEALEEKTIEDSLVAEVEGQKEASQGAEEKEIEENVDNKTATDTKQEITSDKGNANDDKHLEADHADDDKESDGRHSPEAKLESQNVEEEDGREEPITEKETDVAEEKGDTVEENKEGLQSDQVTNDDKAVADIDKKRQSLEDQ